MPGSTQEIPRTTIVDLSLNAVALCNTGANSRAYIVLNKRKENNSMSMTYEELLKSLKPEHAAVIKEHLDNAVNAAKEEVKGQQDTVEKGKATEQPQAAAAQPEDDPVMKNLPEEVKKKFEEMQKTIATLAEERATEMVNKRYEACKALPVEEEELKSVLKAASPAVFEILKKAAAALEAKTHSPSGTDNTGELQKTADAVYAKLEKAARKLQEENKDLTFEQAFVKATEQDPETYAVYSKGVR